MSKLLAFLAPPHPTHSAEQTANPMPHLIAVRDEGRKVVEEIPPALDKSAGLKTRHIVETIPAQVIEDTRQVSAFIEEYVPIPWLDGNQRLAK